MKGDIPEYTEAQDDKAFRAWMGEDMSNEPREEEDEENTTQPTVTIGEAREKLRILGTFRAKHPSGD